MVVAVKLSELELENIVHMYTEKEMGFKEIGDIIGLSEGTVKSILVKNNVLIRTRSEASAIRAMRYPTARKYTLNEDYFETWSHEMAYILGFINADGCIIANKDKNSYLLKIVLIDSDHEHLEKIKDALGFNGDVKFVTNKAHGKIKETKGCSLTINSKKLVNDIIKMGIVERKSMVKEVPKNLPEEYELDYIRGYFDGNGTVGRQYPTNSKGIKTKTCQIRVRIIIGSPVHLEQVQKLLAKHGLKNKRVSKSTSKTASEITYSTKESIELYNLLYKNKKEIHLTRKKERFEEVVDERHETLNAGGSDQ